MAQETVHQVLQLKQRLAQVNGPSKVLKVFKRLQELNITIDILMETGIGKTVNKFRKDNTVGDVAKDLISHWKTLVPQEIPSSQTQHKNKNSQRNSRKTSKHKSPELSCHKKTSHSTKVNKCPKASNENEISVKTEMVESHQQLPEANGDQLKISGCEASQKRNRKSSRKVQDKKKGSSHKDQSRSVGKDKTSTGRRQENEKYPAENSPSSHNASRQERAPSDKDARENAEKRSNKSATAVKHSKLRSKTHKRSAKDKEKRKSDASKNVPKVAEESVKKGNLLEVQSEDEFESQRTSFESYLNYEEPLKRTKKAQTSKRCEDVQMCNAPKREHDGAGKSLSGGNKGKRDLKYRAEQRGKDIWLETPSKKAKMDISALLDIPLPQFLPEFSILPPDSPPTSPTKKSTLNTSCESTEFTGQRLNSKMQVYSGLKATNLPKMMTLYEQCIRVLQNNIDSIHTVGGVPFEILEPVLDRCTPEQLYHIEDCNPSFVEETDCFWVKHCKRYFKSKRLLQDESWREMYLRLYSERERRLKVLTQSISSAHANKPRGRQVKLAYINTSAKRPHNTRRWQQEKHGTSAQSSPFDQNKLKSVRSTEKAGGVGRSGFPDGNHAAHPGADSKKQGKKIAPMMAKSLRTFKNRIGPR
uniref:Transcription elongation factor B polypeptide 3 n=1 Tax=Callorhinchus milii TaxID=7868 RepID=V9KJK9_CALMI